jgi:hypothetical protein
MLDNSAVLSRTVTENETELADTVQETHHLAHALLQFVDGAGPGIIDTAANTVQPLEVLAEYSEMFPCLFRGMNALGEKEDVIFSNGTVHGQMVIGNPQPTAYDPKTERPVLPSQSELDAFDLTNPRTHGYRPNPADPDNPFPAGLGTVCDELYQAASGNPRSPDELFLWPRGWWKMFGVKNSHNGNFGNDADYNRARISDNAWATLLVQSSRR